MLHRIGDIFTSDAQALVNPVNCVGVMGAGLARQFREAFPDMYKQYRKDCANGLYQPGTCRVYYGARTVINLATKDHWRDPSRLEWIRTGIESLAALGFSSVALPRLGCGLGGLRWSDVRPIIELLPGAEIWSYT